MPAVVFRKPVVVIGLYTIDGQSRVVGNPEELAEAVEELLLLSPIEEVTIRRAEGEVNPHPKLDFEKVG